MERKVLRKKERIIEGYITREERREEGRKRKPKGIRRKNGGRAAGRKEKDEIRKAW